MLAAGSIVRKFNVLEYRIGIVFPKRLGNPSAAMAGSIAKTAEIITISFFIICLPISSECLEPGVEFGEHLGVVEETCVYAPSVAATGINHHGGRDVQLFQTFVIVDGIERWHRGVVVGKGDEGARCAGVHLQFVAIEAHLVCRGRLADEAFVNLDG